MATISETLEYRYKEAKALDDALSCKPEDVSRFGWEAYKNLLDYLKQEVIVRKMEIAERQTEIRELEGKIREYEVTLDYANVDIEELVDPTKRYAWYEDELFNEAFRNRWSKECCGDDE